MHIHDGILNPAVCAAGGIVSLGAVRYSLARLREDLSGRSVPLTAMTAAVVFAGQMVNFPLGVAPVSGHLVGGVLAAVIAGPYAGCLALALVLLVQFFLFADGGLLALCVNILHMSVIGGLGGYAIYSVIRRRFLHTSQGVILGTVAAAWLTVVAGAAMFCLEFWISQRPEGFWNLFGLMIGVHCLIGFGEALITGLIVAYIVRVRPDLIHTPGTQTFPQMRLRTAVITGLIAALGIATLLSPYASEHPDGLEFVAARQGFDALTESTVLLFEDYSIPALDDDSEWRKYSGSVAGLLGTTAVFGIAIGLGRRLAPPQPQSHLNNSRQRERGDRARILTALAMIVVGSFIPLELWPLSGVLLCAVFAAQTWAGVPSSVIMRRLTFFFPPIALIALSIPLAQGFQGGWEIAGTILIRCLLTFMIALWLVHAVPFSRLLRSLQSMGVPTLIVSSLGLMQRYLVVIWEELQRMRQARQARSFGRRSTWREWLTSSQLLAALLIRVLDRSDRIHKAMLSRGWDGTIRSFEPQTRETEQ